VPLVILGSNAIFLINFGEEVIGYVNHILIARNMSAIVRSINKATTMATNHPIIAFTKCFIKTQ
jgi:uncharacterized membrane protein YbjE (DUF340 family)